MNLWLTPYGISVDLWQIPCEGSGVPVWGHCESVADPCVELVWVSGRSLSGVGLWEGPVQGQCGCVGGFSLGHCGSVGGSLSGSVWVCLGLCVGLLGALCWISVWMWEVPLWGQCGSDPLFEGDPPLLSFLHLTAGEGQGPLHVCFLAVLSASLCVIVPAPPTQHSPLGASERTWHEAGSGAVLCAPLCELWGALNGLGQTPSLRPWLSLHARHGGCGAEAGRPRERTQHKQARVLCPHSPGPGPTCGGPDRHGGGAIPAGS